MTKILTSNIQIEIFMSDDKKRKIHIKKDLGYRETNSDYYHSLSEY